MLTHCLLLRNPLYSHTLNPVQVSPLWWCYRNPPPGASPHPHSPLLTDSPDQHYKQSQNLDQRMFRCFVNKHNMSELFWTHIKRPPCLWSMTSLTKHLETDSEFSLGVKDTQKVWFLHIIVTILCPKAHVAFEVQL